MRPEPERCVSLSMDENVHFYQRSANCPQMFTGLDKEYPFETCLSQESKDSHFHYVSWPFRKDMRFATYVCVVCSLGRLDIFDCLADKVPKYGCTTS